MTIRALIAAIAVVLLAARVPWPLVVVAAIVTYLWWAYKHPFRPHARCGGTGRNPLSTARRRGPCKGCDGGMVRAWDYRILRAMVRGIGTGRDQIGSRKT